MGNGIWRIEWSHSVWIATKYICTSSVLSVFLMQALPNEKHVIRGFGAVSYVNMCLNPLIYASRYEVVKKSWKDLKQKITG